MPSLSWNDIRPCAIQFFRDWRTKRERATVCSNWPVTSIESIEDFVDWLAEANQHPERVYRGQADSGWHLQPSLDRAVPKRYRFKDRREEEDKYIRSFCNQARQLLGRDERNYLDYPERRELRMTIMQHYGAPTRLLDWTKTRAIAAYFACIHKENLNGTIWWINAEEVVEWLTPRWEGWEYKRRESDRPSERQIILDGRIDDPKAPDFVSMTYLPDPFKRVKDQDGLFTFGSQLGLAHDFQLKAQLKKGSYGRVVIPADLKTEVIQELERIRIDAISLEYAGADRVGLRMAWDREHRDKP